MVIVDVITDVILISHDSQIEVLNTVGLTKQECSQDSFQIFNISSEQYIVKDMSDQIYHSALKLNIQMFC